MAFGLEIRNAAGSVVVNSVAPVLAVHSYEVRAPHSQLGFATNTGTYAYPGGGGYEQPSAPWKVFAIPRRVGGLSVLPFIKLGVGDWLIHNGTDGANNGSYYVYTNKSSLEIAYAAPVSDLAPPVAGGYGIAAYDAAGGVTFNSDHPMVYVRGSLQNTTGVTGEWFCLAYVQQAYPSAGHSRAYTGIHRNAATTIRKRFYSQLGGSVSASQVFPNFGLHADIDPSQI